MNNFDELPMVEVIAAVPTQKEGVPEANHDKTPDINESSEAAAADNDHDMDLNLPLLFSNNLTAATKMKAKPKRAKKSKKVIFLRKLRILLSNQDQQK